MATPCPACSRNSGLRHCKSKTCPWTHCTGCNSLFDKGGRTMRKLPPYGPKEP